MKRFLLHIVVFALLFALVDKLFYLVIAHNYKDEYDKRLQYVLEGQMNKDVIILGSSRGAHGFVAKQIEEKTNQSTYNLSYRGTDITFQYFILKTLLIHNKAPKTVVLTIDPTYEFVDNKTLKFRYYKLFAVKKNNYINDQLIQEGKHSYLSKFFCLARLNKNDFKLNKKPVKQINKQTSHGSKILVKTYDSTLVYKHNVLDYNIENENIKKLEAFRNMQKLCEANNINLVYAFLPSFEAFDNSFFNRFNSLVENKQHIFVYDTTNPMYKQRKWFIDKTHLNAYGAELYTSDFTNFLSQVK